MDLYLYKIWTEIWYWRRTKIIEQTEQIWYIIHKKNNYSYLKLTFQLVRNEQHVDREIVNDELDACIRESQEREDCLTPVTLAINVAR